MILLTSSMINAVCSTEKQSQVRRDPAARHISTLTSALAAAAVARRRPRRRRSDRPSLLLRSDPSELGDDFRRSVRSAGGVLTPSSSSSSSLNYSCGFVVFSYSSDFNLVLRTNTFPRLKSTSEMGGGGRSTNQPTNQSIRNFFPP